MGLLPRHYPSAAPQPKIPWSAWVGVLHSRDKEKETVSKSNWRGEQTKIRTVDIDSGKTPPCSACKDANKEMRMKMLGKLRSCVTLVSDTLHVHVASQAWDTEIRPLFYMHTFLTLKRVTIKIKAQAVGVL